METGDITHSEHTVLQISLKTIDMFLQGACQAYQEVLVHLMVRKENLDNFFVRCNGQSLTGDDARDYQKLRIELNHINTQIDLLKSFIQRCAKLGFVSNHSSHECSATIGERRNATFLVYETLLENLVTCNRIAHELWTIDLTDKCVCDEIQYQIDGISSVLKTESERLRPIIYEP